MRAYQLILIHYINMNKLTLEQEFQLALYAKQIRELDAINLKKYVFNILQQMMIQENFIKYYLKKYMY